MGCLFWRGSLGYATEWSGTGWRTYECCFPFEPTWKKALMISKVGTDEKGYELIDFMNNNQVPADLIQQDDNYSTSVVLATPRTKSGSEI